MTGARDLTSLFTPRSVLLVGATGDTLKWGGWVTKSLAGTRHLRDTHFVSRRGGELYGLQVATSIAEVNARIDLAVIVVPAAGVPEAVTQSLALGAKAIVIITSGFGESGPEGAAVQQALVDEVRAAGAVMLGPNCLGLWRAMKEFSPMQPHHACAGARWYENWIVCAIVERPQCGLGNGACRPVVPGVKGRLAATGRAAKRLYPHTDALEDVGRIEHRLAADHVAETGRKEAHRQRHAHIIRDHPPAVHTCPAAGHNYSLPLATDDPSVERKGARRRCT